MENEIECLLSYCSEIDFGTVNLSDRQKEFYDELNQEIRFLCETLPESIQTEALLFFMKNSGISIGEKLDFFKNYYVPGWSLIYWLIQTIPDDKELEQEDIKSAITSHSMAMFLHSLDDHLIDGERPVTHLTLLLRSQAWVRMKNAFKCSADEVDGGEDIIRTFIDAYYSSICGSEEVESLDSYCNHFRKQMATWLIVPLLMTKKVAANEEFTDAIRGAYESFGIAWRLLDDIQDIKIDMMKGSYSAIYVCLPNDIRHLWGGSKGEKIDKRSSGTKVILDYVLENKVIEKIRKKICSELKSAASISDHYDMAGLANEFRCLVKPLENSRNYL